MTTTARLSPLAEIEYRAWWCSQNLGARRSVLRAEIEAIQEAVIDERAHRRALEAQLADEVATLREGSRVLDAEIDKLRREVGLTVKRPSLTPIRGGRDDG